MKKGTDEHNDAMLRIAQLYYEQQLTQDQIARRMVLTRWKVGRLLEDAKEAGIVRIQIVHPRARRREAEQSLIAKFGLTGAVVVPSEGDASAQRLAVAKAAAEFLHDLKPKPAVLGVSWGNTLHDVAVSMPPRWTRGVEVVQINGAVSRSRQPSSGADAASEIARQGGGTVSLLSAPAIVEKASTRKVLESEPGIGDVLRAGREADVLLFSLGALSTRSVLVEAGYLTPADIDRLREQGATGDLLGRFVDAKGKEVDAGLRARTVALTLDDVRKAPCSIAVASGVAKADVARAVVGNGLCTVLVTDTEVVTLLMESA
ncbi:MAG TPA: sugar-binding transcriptional regulator [Nocardioidaceae bacterium]|nr:sugar-binding transcriptional regulator [Nocardioidaceae bacterium]